MPAAAFDERKDFRMTDSNIFQEGFSFVKGAVSTVGVEQQGVMKAFTRLCSDGWAQGWHERNGGNLTYRMKPDEVNACRSFFYDVPGSWVDMGIQAPGVGGEFFITTGSGKYFRNVGLDVDSNVGIVEVNADGSAWRIVWGLKGNGYPTSELPCHILCHEARKQATSGANRVIYHAHPSHIIALTKVVGLDARSVTRALWKSMSECAIVFPEGVDVIGWMVPGSLEIARATGDAMGSFNAVLWAHHGIFCAGSDFDSAFGLMHAIEKAAEVYGAARMMNGGHGDFLNTIDDSQLRKAAAAVGAPINETFLD